PLRRRSRGRHEGLVDEVHQPRVPELRLSDLVQLGEGGVQLRFTDGAGPYDLLPSDRARVVEPELSVRQAEGHQLVGQQASTSPAAPGRFAAVRGFPVVPDDPLEDEARFVDQVAGPGVVAGVLVDVAGVAVLCGIEPDRPATDRVDHRVEHVDALDALRAKPRDHVLFERPPAVAALPGDDELHSELLRDLDDVVADGCHVLLPHEQAEISQLGVLGREGVVDARLVEEQHVALEGLEVQEEVRRGGHEHRVGGLIDLNPDVHALLFPDLVPTELDRVLDGRRRQAEVVSRALARLDNRGDVPRGDPTVHQDGPDRPSHIRLVEPERADLAAASALQTLVVVGGKPLDRGLVLSLDPVPGPEQTTPEAVGPQGTSYQIGPAHRRVVDVAGREVRRTGVETRAAPNAGVQRELHVPLRAASTRIPARTSHGRVPVERGAGTLSFSLARSSGFAQNGFTEEVSPYGNWVASAIDRYLPPGERVTGAEARFSAATGKLAPVTVGLNR